MGKGDQRSRRGKIFRGTHGKTRLKTVHPVKKKGPQSPHTKPKAGAK